MTRPTTSVKIGEHTFLIKSYATAREAQAIQQAYFKGTKLEVVGDQPKIAEFNPAVQDEVNMEMVRQMVITFDDVPEDIVERALDLPNPEYQELIEELDKLVSKKKS